MENKEKERETEIMIDKLIISHESLRRSFGELSKVIILIQDEIPEIGSLERQLKRKVKSFRIKYLKIKARMIREEMEKIQKEISRYNDYLNN